VIKASIPGKNGCINHKIDAAVFPHTNNSDANDEHSEAISKQVF
jgi:hypothetical protein